MAKEKPPHCISCGLYENCRTWKIPARKDTRKDHRIRDKYILILGQAPGYNEDKLGRCFVGPSGQFVQQFLDQLECRWVLENAAKCYPGRSDDKGDNAPTTHQIEMCGTYVAQTIQRYDPDVIICLGKVAMESVWGKKSMPKTIKAARIARKVDVCGRDRWVMAEMHPVNHLRGRTNLFDRYLALFQQAEQLVLGEKEDVVFKYATCNMSHVAKSYFPRIPYDQPIILDIETNQSSGCASRKTARHPNTRMLCFVISWSEMDGKVISNVIFHGAILDDVELWKEFFRDRWLVPHNTKYDIGSISHYFGFDMFKILRRWNDTFAYFSLQDAGSIGNSLKDLAQVHLGALPWTKKIDDQMATALARRKALNKWIRKQNKKRRADNLPVLQEVEEFASLDPIDVDPKDLHEYCARDGYWTMRILNEVIPKLNPQPSPVAMQLYDRATYALSRIEATGMPVDVPRMHALERALRKKIRLLRTYMKTLPEVQKVEAGFSKMNPTWMNGDALEGADGDGWHIYAPSEFNVKSNLFLGKLSEVLDYHTGDLSETGQLSFHKDVTRALGGIFPKVAPEERTRAQWIFYYIEMIKQHRTALTSSWGPVKLRPYIINGRIHTTYRLGKVSSSSSGYGADMDSGGTETGRLSSAQATLHNVRKWDLLRRCFIALPGWNVLEWDYDRIELVVLAFLSRDPQMMEDLLAGKDLHTVMGMKLSEALGEDYDPKFHRELGKRANFAKVYGESPQTFAARNGIELKLAMKIYEEYDKTYPTVREFFAEVTSKIKRGEALYTPFGLRRTFRLTGNRIDDIHTILEACNFIIQSTATYITCWKLCEMYDWLDERPHRHNNMEIINTVHDSVWPMIRETYVPTYYAACKDIMEDMSTLPFEFDLPLKVSAKRGLNYGDMKEYVL